MGGVTAQGMKRILKDLDVLEGVPPEHTDAFVLELMQRADQDHDGLLDVSDFVLCFLTEVAATLPLKVNGSPQQQPFCAPLYNRLLYFTLMDSGEGVRRKVREAARPGQGVVPATRKPTEGPDNKLELA